MTLELARRFFLWCTVLDYAVLTTWFLAFVFAHDAMHRLHGRWFTLSRERFDAIHYAGMAAFKIGTLVLALVPFLALCLVG
ncbi:MAG TPA: hypothetical protein VMW35_19170 [Myxococcota bacterium]|jgi:hypothetical protein|nr:hypothetical protein [Myxococcota bacterium]